MFVFGKSNVLTTYPYQDCVYIGLINEIVLVKWM